LARKVRALNRGTLGRLSGKLPRDGTLLADDKDVISFMRDSAASAIRRGQLHRHVEVSHRLLV